MNISGLPDYVRSCDLDKGSIYNAAKSSPYIVKIVAAGFADEMSLELYSDASGRLYLYLRELLEPKLLTRLNFIFTIRVYARGNAAPELMKSFHAVYCREPDPFDPVSFKSFAEKNFLSSSPQIKLLADIPPMLATEVICVFSSDPDEAAVSHDVSVEYVDADGRTVAVSKSFDFEVGDSLSITWVRQLFELMCDAFPDLAGATLKSMSVTAGQRSRTYYFTSDPGYWELLLTSEFAVPETVHIPLQIEESSKMSAETVVLASGARSVADRRVDDTISATAYIDIPTAMYLRRQLGNSGFSSLRKCGSGVYREVAVSSVDLKIVDSRSAEIKFSFIQSAEGYAFPPSFHDALSPSRIFSSHFSSQFS